jgi:hypothetical protein
MTTKEALRFEKYGPPSVFSPQEFPGCHTNWPQAALDAAIDEIISGGRADLENQETNRGLMATPPMFKPTATAGSVSHLATRRSTSARALMRSEIIWRSFSARAA